MAPGARPRNELEKMVIHESHHIVLINPKDFKNRANNSYPVVLAYNGRNHFAPTRVCLTEEFQDWKVRRQLCGLLSSTLICCKELDINTLPAEYVQPIEDIQHILQDNLPKLSKRALLQHKKLERQSGRTYHGPWVQKSAASVPGPSSLPEDPGQPQPGAPSSSATPFAAASSGSQPGKHGYKCTVCGKVKTRKPDLEGHMWKDHGMGEPIVCNQGSCNERSFSCKSSLRQHIRTQHNKVFKFPCQHKGCSYGADNPDALLSHRINKHKMKVKKSHDCKYCKKTFITRILLQKHVKSLACQTKKTRRCPHCIRMYKTRAGVEKHVKEVHTGKKSPCPQCGLKLSEVAMVQHLRRHTTARSLDTARRFANKMKARKTSFGFTSRKLAKRSVISTKKPAVSRSAPAKLKRSKSPRGAGKPT